MLEQQLDLGRLVSLRALEFVMGQKQARALSELLIRVGMRGLGINIDYRLPHSGELVLLRKVMPLCGNKVCFDVGANVGDYAQSLLDFGANAIVAFEPGKEAFEQLSSRLGRDPKLTLKNLAVGEKAGVVPFFIPTSSTLASRDCTITAIGADDFVEMTVNMVSLDDFVESEKVLPDFVKIDVEGFELEVILGMRKLVQTHPPKFIQFELNRHHLLRHQNLLDFAEHLPNYSLFRLATHSLRPLKPDHYMANVFSYSNIVAVHESVREETVRLMC